MWNRARGSRHSAGIEQSGLTTTTDELKCGLFKLKLEFFKHRQTAEKNLYQHCFEDQGKPKSAVQQTIPQLHDLRRGETAMVILYDGCAIRNLDPAIWSSILGLTA